MTKTGVSDPSAAYQGCADNWQMIDDLCGGTLSMRAAREKWLPREDRELTTQYDVRLRRSVLYAATKNTIEQSVSRPFSRPVTLNGSELGERMKTIEGDVDRNGQSLTSFGAEVFRSALKYGVTHAIVDYPPAKTDENGNVISRSLKDERDENIHPYFVHVPPTALIGWRFETNTGNKKLDVVRIKSERFEADGQFGEKKIHQVTVWTQSTVSVYESETDKDEDYVLVSDRTHTFGEIPMVSLYLDDERSFTPSLPFEDLAWLNIAHWQSMSDQRNILRVIRVPFMLASGFTKDELGDNISISSARFIRSKNPDAKIVHVEHSGKAVEAGVRDLQRIEDQMTIFGLQPLIQVVGNQTATGKAIDSAKSHTRIQSWIRECESFLYELYLFASRWVRVELPEDFGVDINSDFGFAMNVAQDVTNLIKARMSGEISRRTFLQELKRRGFLSESVVIDSEIEAIEDDVIPPDDGDFPDPPEEDEDPPVEDPPESPE